MQKELNYQELKNFFGEVPLFIFPTNTYGGHEIMTLEIIKHLLTQSCSIRVALERKNKKLIEELSYLNIDLEIIILPVKQQRFEFLHAIFNINKKNKVVKFMRDMIATKPSSTVIVQGDIELGAIYVSAAKRIKMPFYSYIPYAHSARKMGKKLSFFRDLYYPYVYSNVDSFVTISNIFAKQLKSYNKNCHVYILKNKVRDVSSFSIKRLELSRERESKIFNAAIIGRVNFKQKGHDVLIQAVNKLSNNTRDGLKIDIIGSGPDLDRLKDLVNGLNLDGVFKFHDWTQEPWDIAFNNDLLIIPSKFEGVPLIMLEALSIGIDILASKVDGMIDYLDDDRLFNDENELAILLEKKINDKILH